MALFNVTKKQVDDKYTMKVGIPQYLPSDVCPQLYTLFDRTKYNELMRDINLSNCEPEVKEFLKFAATRHIVFNYSKIADYYAHADAETQRLMEKSALVIIDPEDAIANGYARLSDKIKHIMEESGVKANAK